MRKAKPLTRADIVTEKHIENTITEWLSYDGWIALVTDPKQLRGLGVSEPGMPDKQYRRYMCRPGGPLFNEVSIASRCDLFWLEFKKKGGKSGQHQLDWHKREKERGGLVLLVGVDCEASIDGVMRWYRESGLMRRKI